MCWTTSSVRILSAWRRFVPTVVSVTTGVSVSAVSTPRPPAGGDAPSVSQRRSNLLVLSSSTCAFHSCKIHLCPSLKLKRNSGHYGLVILLGHVLTFSSISVRLVNYSVVKECFSWSSVKLCQHHSCLRDFSFGHSHLLLITSFAFEGMIVFRIL